MGQIQSCIALFLLDDKTPIISPLITPTSEGDLRMENGKVYIVLWQQVTRCRALRIQVVCYGDTAGQTFIDSTPVSERILFRRSLPGTLDDYPEISDNPGILVQLIAWMHFHPNKPILDALTEGGDGELEFNGVALATAEALQEEAGIRCEHDNDIRAGLPDALANIELDDLINNALGAIQP